VNHHQRRAQGEPGKAEFERIAGQIKTAGCACCGLPHLVARTKRGWVGRCMRPNCNSDFLPGPLFMGIGIFAVPRQSQAHMAAALANAG
jgi:hypothetical protein